MNTNAMMMNSRNVEAISYVLTKHALERMQQRGISRFDVDMLFRFGSTIYVHGAKAKIFDKRSIKKINSYLGKNAKSIIESHRNIYLLLSENNIVVTVAHQTKHLKSKH